jgi:hypothetical protein
MNKKYLFLLGLILIFGALSPTHQPVQAQDDLQTTLDTINLAYTNAAALQSYAAQWNGETAQTTRLSEGENSYIVATTVETTQSAQIEGANISSSVEQAVNQGQTLAEGGAEATGPNLASELELNADLVLIDGRVFINLDATSPEFRAGLPEGWQEARAGVALGINSSVSLMDIAASLDNVQLDAQAISALLNSTTVTSVEALEDDELDGQAMQRYLLTLNYAEVMKGQDVAALLGDFEVSEETLNTLLSGATYTIEVWIGVDDQTVHQQVITFNLTGEFDAGGVIINVNHEQADTLTLSEFNSDFDISVPPTLEVVG